MEVEKFDSINKTVDLKCQTYPTAPIKSYVAIPLKTKRIQKDDTRIDPKIGISTRVTEITSKVLETLEENVTIDQGIHIFSILFFIFFSFFFFFLFSFF